MDKLESRLEKFFLKRPHLGKNVFVGRGAIVMGDVTVADHASIWYNAVLRGDINRIVIGEGTNIQDNCVVHLADDYPCLVGDYVTVGHGAILHACTIGNEVLVGMGATVLDGAVVGDQCLIGAHALVTPGTVVPPGSMVLGSPGKIVKQLSPEQRASLKPWADKYVQYAAYCLQNKINGPLPE